MVSGPTTRLYAPDTLMTMNATDAGTIIVLHGESLPVAQPATDLATPKI